MEWYNVWWPWLTSKRVARVCQHQLSFLFTIYLQQAVRVATQYASAPWKLTISSYLFARWHLFRYVGYLRHQQQVDLLTFKVVSESRVTWATFVQILVFLGLSILELGPMYATDIRRQTDIRQTKASLKERHSATVWIRQEHRQSLQTGVSAVIIHRYHNRMSSRLFTCQPEGWTGKNIPHWGRLAVSLIITYVTRSKFRRVFCALPTCLNIKLRS